MKKRLMMFVCTLVLMFGMSLTVMADVSPTGKADTTTSTTKRTTSPKTGESDMFLYGIIGAAALSGAAVVSRKRLEELQ